MKAGRTIARLPIENAPGHRRTRPVIACVGTPNTGKSTLFNLLTGLKQKTGNYPGVTVEKHVGLAFAGGRTLELIDLPGTYSLSPASLDERVAVDVLHGRLEETGRPDGVLAVIDATRLAQGLYLVRQLHDLGLPLAVALTMTDAAQASGLLVDAAALEEALDGIPVCPVVGTTGAGIDGLREVLARLPSATAERPGSWPALRERAERIAAVAEAPVEVDEVERALLDAGMPFAVDLSERLGPAAARLMDEAARELFGDHPPQAAEARFGHAWARRVASQVQHRAPPLRRLGSRLLRALNRPLPASLLFLATMLLVFQAVFAWATPLMDAIDAGTSALGEAVADALPEGALSSLLVDGVIAGVGSVVIFLPQILLLFVFVIVLEDTGFLARSAFLMDRAMRSLGLSGQSVIPMLSGFACAVPAIMAARTVPTWRERLATILATPFMTCSARLPVYALLIGAFVPQTRLGWLNLQGLVLLGLYLLGILGGAVTSLLVSRMLLRGSRSGFAMSLPAFRMPNWRTVTLQLLDRARVFLRRAGTIIFSVSIIVWVLTYFPRPAEPPPAQAGVTVEEERTARQLANSYLGRAGRFVEPVFEPLGWDWRVSAAVIAGFPAREVVVAVLGTVYAVGSEPDEERLSERLRAARWPDGRRVFTLPMVLGLLVFYALCLQCAATVAAIRRETNSWRWPLFAWTYMTGLAYLSALLVFQLAS